MTDTHRSTPEPQEFYISVIAPDGTHWVGIERHPDAAQALRANLDQAGIGGRIEVRPLVERTYGQGASRYPAPLNTQASDEARAGWQDACARDVALRNRLASARADHEALVRQVNHPADPLTRAMGWDK